MRGKFFKSVGMIFERSPKLLSWHRGCCLVAEVHDMRRHWLDINWAAGATIGALAFLLLRMSACSGSTQPLAPLPSPSRADGITSFDRPTIEKVDLRGIRFLRDGSIGPNSEPVLDSAVEILKKKPNATIYVDAYCDPTGGPKLNQQLSEARALAVASYLEKHGISDEHVVPRGFGASHFVASNTTASGRSQNRRIELVVRPNSG
jgi:outer membrane protein OmpA-like peptidoglycan-associated protein